ncbi:auxin efflux carrier, AEC family [Thermosulfidibacter takaii ABI70S6]|uniref:Auxin efflux carrier, AEC family n=1 Tax=Thermosulfidibacter takaii (strain DSM 17441 / JCM 13301 / NBRC 103674 / ABI70S6) TaxID=1298851 RepID=A0A0S3QS42_THET7|nr:AEC family transporter [Thermosulfidibacter takaii]BAT71105.1 auxin efflux carrier, AEC family [Thermosulfidibacter takaii ABI70S6]
MLQLFVDVLVPVYILIALGFLIGKIKPEIETKSISTLVLDIFAPALVFASFRGVSFNLLQMASVVSGAVSVVFGCYLLVLVVEKFLLKHRNEALEISSTFMNSGYMGIPLIFLMFGKEMFPEAITYSVAMTFLHFTFGIVILKGGDVKEGIKEVLRMPIVYAMVLAPLTKDIGLPKGIEKMLSMTGYATLPVMLVCIGISLSKVRVTVLRLAVTGTVLRFLGGFIFGLLGVIFWNVPASVKAAVVVQSSLPSAVMNYVLCDKYDKDAELASSIILISTSVFPLFLPLLRVAASIAG